VRRADRPFGDSLRWRQGAIVWSVFRDRPIPGDLVIRRRFDLTHSAGIYVVTRWPESEAMEAGPFPSYAAALTAARQLVVDRYAFIWYDYARPGEPERLDQVGGGDLG
jgi:hypothetical protein